MTLERVRVGDVLELNRTPISVGQSKEYARVGIYSWGRGLFVRPAVPGNEMGSLRYFTFPTGALVVSNIQAWEGAVAVSSTSEQHAVASNRFLPYVPIAPDSVDVRFVWHFLMSDRGMVLLRRASPGTQVRNRTLNRSLFEAIEIPLPDLAEQKRIADHLDRLAAAEAPRPKGALARATVLGLVHLASAGTARQPLGDLLSLDLRRFTPEPEASHRPIGVRGFGRGLIRYGQTATEELSKLKYYDVRPDRLVVSTIKAWEGAVAVTDASDAGRISSSRFLQYRAATPAVRTRWCLLYLLTREGRAALESSSPGSADRNRTLNRPAFERISVPVPGIEVQDHVIGASALADRADRLSRCVSELRDALLPAARNEIFSNL